MAILDYVCEYALTNYGVRAEEHSAFYFTLLGAVVFVSINLVAPLFCYVISPMYRDMSTHDKKNFEMHLTSGFHAAVGGYHGYLIFMEDPSLIHVEYLFEPLFMDKAIMAFHLGYFVQDFFYTLYNHKYCGDMATYIHHISVGTSFAISIKFNLAVWMSGSLLSNEITGPFLHFRWFIKRYNFGTFVTEFNAFLMVSSYFVCRLLLTAYHLVNGIEAEKYIWFSPDCTASFGAKVFINVLWVPLLLQFCLNLFWFKKIVKFSVPIMRTLDYLGVAQYESRLDATVCTMVSEAERRVHESADKLKETVSVSADTLKKSVSERVSTSVNTLLDSQNEKPKTVAAVRVQYVIRALTWLGGALLFCTDIARRSRTYGQSVEMFCYVFAVVMVVMGMFSLFFNTAEPAPRRRPVSPQVDTAAKVKAN